MVGSTPKSNKITGIDIMEDHLGLQEIRDNKELKKFFRAHGFNIDPASTPWCAVMVNCCERAAGNLGNGKLNARSFATYGDEVKLAGAKVGDIVVFERGSNGWSGHVAYFVEYDKANNVIKCLGGNQADMVCYSNYSKDRLITIRRPK